MIFRSSNPVYRSASHVISSDTPVTYANVTLKTVFLVLLTAASGILGLVYAAYIPVWAFYAAIPVAFVSSLLGIFIRRLTPVFAVIYALAEGLFLGWISFILDYLYHGIVFTALATTIIVLLVMMLLYSMKIIKVGQGFAAFMVIAMIAVIVMSIILIFVGFSGPLYYLVCIGSALLATLYLFLDFRNIQNCVEAGTDQSVGWVLALGLMVSLVWLYIEILRLLAIFANRRR